MRKKKLPAKLMGEWIWSSHPTRKYNQIFFFRREFLLDSLPSFTDFHISSSHLYHLYINGQHVAFGPAAAPAGKLYCDQFDVSLYLQVGMNTIAMIAEDLALPNYSYPVKTPAIWCQLSIDDKPVLWTNEEWSVHNGDVAFSGTARRNFGLEFVEKHDMEHYPAGFSESGFHFPGWESAIAVCPIEELGLELVPYPCEPCTFDSELEMKPLIYGTFQKKNLFTYVYFKALSGTGSQFDGSYAARTYVFCKKATTYKLDIASDDPFVLLLNRQVVCSRAVEYASYRPGQPKQHNPLEFSDLRSKPITRVELSLEQGWNRLVVIQRSNPNGMGAALLFPELESHSFKFLRDQSHDALPGWKIAGPLKMPVEMVTAALHLDRIDSIPFSPVDENINDASTWLAGCQFQRDTEKPYKNTLSQGKYAIYELPSLTYGFPVVELEGVGGDIVDITTGIEVVDSSVVTLAPLLGRNTDTIILKNGTNTFARLYPRGGRFIMISVRKASGPILIHQVKMRQLTRSMMEQSSFSCSDPVFNQIWNRAMDSLRQSMNLSFLDNPCVKRCQSMLETFVQSVSAFYLYGDIELSEKALREFAQAQIETGCMPDNATSDLMRYQVDYALLWPIWLNYYWNFTGNTAFRDEMLPHLDRLLDYFKDISARHENLLVCVDAHTDTYLTEPGGISRKGILTAVNALYCRALLSSLNLYESADRTDSAKTAKETAALCAEQMRQSLYDERKGFFVDSMCDGVKSRSTSLHSNLLAILSGVANEDCLNRLLGGMIFDSIIENSTLASKFNLFILETLFSLGRSETAFRLLKSAHQNLMSPYRVDSASRREDYDEHVGRIIPGMFLFRELLGVRGAMPGMRQIYFSPAVTVVTSAKGSMRTPHGRILVDWCLKDGELEVTIDSNYPLDIALQISPELLAKATFHLGKSVNILDSGEFSS